MRACESSATLTDCVTRNTLLLRLSEEANVDAGAKLTIQNATPFPMTWAHLEYEDGPTNPVNVLQRTLPENKAQLVEGLRPGRLRVVCAFEPGEMLEHPTRCASRYLDLAPEDGYVVWAVFDRAEGFSMRAQDARLEREEVFEEFGYRRRYVWDGKPVARRSR
jgi:hypothetical protein